MTTKRKSKYPPNADQSGLKRVGKGVRERLAGNPQAYRVPVDSVELWAFGDFMTANECAKMRGLIDETARPSSLLEETPTSDFRTSYTGDVDAANPFVRKINRRIDDLLGIDPDFGETIQGQRYEPGQEFKPHYDWFHPDTSYWEELMESGGQRSFTAMIFLNNVEEGGETAFPKLGTSLTPKEGVLVAWNNATPDGLFNDQIIHAGTPVKAGVKYIITKWYRARHWG